MIFTDNELEEVYNIMAQDTEESKQDIHLGVMVTPNLSSDIDRLRERLKRADKTSKAKAKKYSRSAMGRMLIEIGLKNFAEDDRNIKQIVSEGRR